MVLIGRSTSTPPVPFYLNFHVAHIRCEFQSSLVTVAMKGCKIDHTYYNSALYPLPGVVSNKGGYQIHSLDMVPHKPYNLMLVFGGVERSPQTSPPNALFRWRDYPPSWMCMSDVWLMTISLMSIVSFWCHSNSLRMVNVLLTCPSFLMVLTRFLTDRVAGVLGTKFSACSPVNGSVAAITTTGAATGVATTEVVIIVIGC